MAPQPAENQNKAILPHIFLDLDGVLSDFDLHKRQEGKTLPGGATNYNALDYKWWSTMPVFDGAKEFYDAARKLGVVKFLTGPVPHEDCFAGKAHWVRNFVPERGKNILKDLIICSSGDKQFLARPNHILVDDRIANINEWRAAGGIGIHHTGDFAETMKQLQAAVAQITTPAPVTKPRRRFPGLG
jgi:hypothetical protein